MRVDEGRQFIQINRDLFEDMNERSRTISRYRIAVEWGNKMVKDFKIFEKPLTTDTRKRLLIFLNVVHLINYRTRVMGINQITKSFYLEEDN